MKNSPMDVVLNKSKLTEKEKKAFVEIIQYAKSCQKSQDDNLKGFIKQKVEEVVQNEVSKN
ncbi:MAG: hypothetical protein V8R15_00670 [Bacilli bacterium]|jgi:hypothetical protein